MLKFFWNGIKEDGGKLQLCAYHMGALYHLTQEDSMRTSCNEMQAGVIRNGFSYELQVWIVDFVIQRCGHPETMDCRCYAKAHAGSQVRVTA